MYRPTGLPYLRRPGTAFVLRDRTLKPSDRSGPRFKYLVHKPRYPLLGAGLICNIL